MVLNDVPAALKTHEDVLARGRASRRHRALAKNNGYYQPPSVVTIDDMPWDAAQRFLTCSSHSLANMMSAVWSCVGNTGKHKFDSRRRRLEQMLGRLEAFADSVASNRTQTITPPQGKRARRTHTKDHDPDGSSTGWTETDSDADDLVSAGTQRTLKRL